MEINKNSELKLENLLTSSTEEDPESHDQSYVAPPSVPPSVAPPPSPSMSWCKLVLYVNLRVIVWQATYYFSKELMVKHGITPFELLMCRTFFISVVSVFQLTFLTQSKETSLIIPPEHKVKLISSALINALGTMLSYVALKYLPIAMNTILLESKQFLLLLLGYCFLRESLTTLEVVAIIISFAAMVLIALKDPNHESDSPYSATKTQYILGFVAGIFSVLTFSVWLTLIRSMKELNRWIIQLYSNTSSVIALAVYFLADLALISERTPF